MFHLSTPESVELTSLRGPSKLAGGPRNGQLNRRSALRFAFEGGHVKTLKQAAAAPIEQLAWLRGDIGQEASRTRV